MSRCLAVSSTNTRQINKVLRTKRSRGNIHSSFRKDHKPDVVRSKKEKLKQLALAAKQETMLLKERMYQQIFGTEEPAFENAFAGENIDTLV